ncbi:hypothetical protein [Bacillus sp. S14(2024)]|uniref:hypothetical protein n=1 Tax=Bacillus sp. S14(2024) TaxID=3162884 RepID=UPI003D1998AC
MKGVVDAQGMAPAAIVELGKVRLEKQLQWYGNHYTVRELGDRLCRLSRINGQ